MLIGSNQIIMIFIVFFLIFSFAIGQVVWIYLDSKKREDKWGILWSILAITPIFLPILLPLPLIVYLLVTRAFSTIAKVSISFIYPISSNLSSIK